MVSVEESLRDLLRSLEERLLQPAVRRSAREVGELLADGFVEFGASGTTYTKPEIIEALTRESPRNISLTDFKVRELSPIVALATYRAVERNETGELLAQSLRSSIWILTDGRWQMLFHQGTPAYQS